MRVIIAGSRTFGSRRADVMAAIDAADSLGSARITEVISGCAPGVDTIGEEWAVDHGIHIRRFPADWDTHGKAAGPIRNRQMAANADALILVWDGSSRGSADMKCAALDAGLLVVEAILGPQAVNLNAWSELRAKARAR